MEYHQKYQKKLGGLWHLSQLKFEEISPRIPRIQILWKLAPLMVPFTVPPVPPGGQQFFWEVSGIYLSSSLKKYHQKHQECRFSENCPPCWSRLLSPLSPLGDKKFLGGFWHLSQLKFEEISPKIPRMQILRKLAPLLVPSLLSPLSPLGVKKIFGRCLASS